MPDNREVAEQLCKDWSAWTYEQRVHSLTAVLDAKDQKKEEDDGVLYFAVWNELSEDCRDDLIHCEGPGYIIRCTERDFGLLAPIPISASTLKALQDRIMAARETQDGRPEADSGHSAAEE